MTPPHGVADAGRRVALITGASRGIGRGIAIELARLGGYDLVVNYASNEGAAQATAADCQAAARDAGHQIRAETARGDVASAGDRQGLIDFVRQRFGRLDLLVNNAGVAPSVRADILEAGEESFDRLIQINLKGPYFLTQLAARYMIEQLGGQPAPPGTRHIVTVTSISAYTASINRGDYCIAKAGLSMHTKLWAARLAEYGIGVFEIQPGIIETDMTAPVKERYDRLFAEGLTPFPRWGTPQDVGRAVAAVAMGHFPYSTGMVIDVDGGFRLRRL
ncbi:MAG TPA: 3-ketoacyl-ACP reductase [Chloroflexota bacterium]|jgi:3-oxoacyl-[acyl-carrier protein] reductase|nr:3-ketoacyl-ACP reductase [Chloroflexota bacterium]